MDNHPFLLQLSGITKTFFSPSAAIEVLKNADLTVSAGETIAITGASGIGKSTLLNIIGTLDKPEKGTLLFEDENPFSYNTNRLSRFRNINIGFVFQFHYLLQGFLSVENVMMPGLIAGKPKKKVEMDALNMLERVGLSDRSTHRVEDLSGGEQQRVALARALAMRPKLLLADEPTGNLDEKNSKSVHRLISELNREMGMTVIVVTHNHDLADMMDRNLTLKEGRIVNSR